MSLLGILTPRSTLNGLRSGVAMLGAATKLFVYAVGQGDIALIGALAFLAVMVVQELAALRLPDGLFASDPMKGSRLRWEALQQSHPAAVTAAQGIVLSLDTIEMAIESGVKQEVHILETDLGKVLAKL